MKPRKTLCVVVSDGARELWKDGGMGGRTS